MELNVKNVAKVGVIAVVAMLVYTKWIAPQIAKVAAKA